MLVAKAMCVVMKLPAILVATWKWHVCADLLKPVSFELGFAEIICSWRLFILGSSLGKLKPSSLSLFDTYPLVCLPWPRVNKVIEGLPEFKALGRKRVFVIPLPSIHTWFG